MKTLPDQPISAGPDTESASNELLDFSVNSQPKNPTKYNRRATDRIVNSASAAHETGLATLERPTAETVAQQAIRAPLPTVQPELTPHPRMGKHSRFVMALALFVAANLALSFSTPFDFDPYKYIYRGWVWWNMNHLRHDTQLHNVALLGSSLVVSAVAGADAVHTQKSLDLTQYHKAAYLDYQLSQRIKGDFNTFNLSAPGQMPSDAYLTLKSMINVSQRPEVVIYGIAPRDFIDSTLSSPADTEPFRYLRRIVNIDDVASGLYHSPIPRLDWCLQRSVYMYANALDMQMSSNEWLTTALANIVPKPTETNRPFTWWDRRQVLPQYLKGEIIPDSMLAVPISPAQAAAQATDNTTEYRERYKHPEPSTYQLQFYFLRRLAYYCRKEKIELVLVNMPITQQNISLLNPTVYLQYVQAIKAFGYDNNVAVMDLCNWSQYLPGDFHDSVHLNAYGGKKFLAHLAEGLAALPRTRLALQMAGAELRRHKEVEASNRQNGETGHAD